MTRAVSSYFLWRRLHSLAGLMLLFYVTIHLLVNSRSALVFGDNGIAFVRFVNGLEALPYLPLIESALIYIPLAIHGVWGIKRALEPKLNSLPYARNRAFTWQRLTSWVLMVGIIGHVAQMRFLDKPEGVWVDQKEHFYVEVKDDPSLPILAERLGADYVGTGQMAKIDAPSPGVAFLFMVRNTFKSPVQAVLYSVFVLVTAFHAMNGFWTALITWGIALSARAQKGLVPLSVVGMAILAFLGLIAIWGN